MKECKKCGTEKDESEFYAHPNTKDRLQSHCKACMKRRSTSAYMSWNEYKVRRRRANDARARARSLEQPDKKKTCIKCNVEFPCNGDYFYNASTRDGFKSYCKTCDNRLKAERRRKKREAKE